jgi:molybdopterin-guanine dinucleotide biosynthesis protein A
MLIPPYDITGVVLCGGEGRRMGGAEKPLLVLDGRTLVSHVLERLAPQVAHVVISANREREAYRASGCGVVPDVTPGLGPLGGLASVAPVVTTPWMFCCPGDAPRLDRALVSRLSAAAGAADLALYPYDGERDQYLFALIRTTACASLADYLASGARSVRGWLASIGGRAVLMQDIAPGFANVNDQVALARLQTEN